MVVAIYRSKGGKPEEIRVHRYASDNKLHIEAVSSSYAKEVGGVYNSLEEVEAFLKQRDRVFGYSLIIKR
jgi:hypothetical protein